MILIAKTSIFSNHGKVAVFIFEDISENLRACTSFLVLRKFAVTRNWKAKKLFAFF